MNIFFLDNSPLVAAQMMHDKHVVKMILESAQILSTVCAAHNAWVPGMYAPTHKNHPSVLWAGESCENWTWLVQHARALCAEYTYRYSRKHKSSAVIELCADNAPLFHTRTLTPPAQAMPAEYRIAGDAIAAYRQYYLGRKVVQSKWTRRPVPDFVKDSEMAKAKQVKPQDADDVVADAVDASQEASTPAQQDATAPAAVKAARRRGPAGMKEDAIISLRTLVNPKRPGSTAHAVFSKYRDGMTVGEFIAEAGPIASTALVYDTQHDFIAVEGYVPKPPVPRTKRAPKPAGTPKAPRGRKPKAKPEAPPPVDPEAAEVAGMVVEELID